MAGQARARHVALIGRSEPSEPAREKIAAMRQAGADVLVVRADVSLESDMQAALARLTESGPPLRGVIHAAGVMEEDEVLARQDPARFARVLAPKVQGAWLLHRLTRDATLDFFVMFSSAATVLGGARHADYVAANAFLDGLAHHRRALGLSACSINWGAWAEVGVVARRDLQARFARQGLHSYAPEEGLRLLEWIIRLDVAQATAALVDWKQFAATLGHSPERAFFEEVLGGFPSEAKEHESTIDAANVRRQLEQAPVKKRRQAVLEQVRAQIRGVLGLGGSEGIAQDKPLLELGMDSLMAVELRNRLRSGMAIRQVLPATLMFDYPTAAALAGYLTEVLFPATTHEETFDQPPDVALTDTAARALDRLEQMPDEEVDRLMAIFMQQQEIK